MRIIAGNFKGRTIKSVPGKETRPTSDKIKEAIFHKLGPFFNGGNCLDLFAGSGSLGIEAISRGMEQVTFVEKSNQAYRVIQQNVKSLSIDEQADMLRMDAFRALPLLKKQGKKYDLILIDPPYEKVSYPKVLETIQQEDLLTDNSQVYVETSSIEDLDYDKTYYTLTFERKYSQTTSVIMLEKNNANIIKEE